LATASASATWSGVLAASSAPVFALEMKPPRFTPLTLAGFSSGELPLAWM